MPIFKLKNVHYKNILHYPDIEIQKGITTFISGESGAGKSTLLKLLNGIVSPTSGEIFYRNKNIDDYDQIALRREVLLVGQSAYLFNMTIKENFREYYAYRDLANISDEDMNFFLQLCAIDFSLDTACETMSGGEQQRIFLAINLSFPSKVLMIDEPLSALDEKNANVLMENIKKHCNECGKTLIVVSHDKAIVEKYADEVINISSKGGERL
jgi:putative ABC transport system ATP-binding protein